MDVIIVKNLTKRFKGYADRAVTLKEKTLFSKRRKYTEREVLKDINLTIKKGEVVGLIGENGCGKSTLLKLMTGILYPEQGSVEIKGRVSSLLELGAGFHQDMSGRENIYINAAIFGLTKKETDERFQKILDFSELHEFIDNPVRTYSSGMYMRLAFSVAINVSADILLIDEILAVGDSNFQAKCFNRLKQLKSEGITIVLVTHDIGVIENFCNRVLWLNNGRIAKDGDRYQISDAYKKYMNDKRMSLFDNGKDFNQEDVYFAYSFFLGRAPESNHVVNACVNGYKSLNEMLSFIMKSEEFMIKKSELTKRPLEEVLKEFEAYRFNMRHQKDMGLIRTDIDEPSSAAGNQESQMRFGNNMLTITDVRFETRGSQNTDYLREGESVKVHIHYKLNEKIDRYVFGINFFTLDDIHCFGASTKNDNVTVSELSDEGVVTCELDAVNLVAGEYKLGVYAEDETSTALDYIRNYKTFYITSEKTAPGLVMLKHEWNISK